MCGATSGQQDRLIEQHEETSMSMMIPSLMGAEVDYRQERVRQQYGARRRHRVSRRRGLSLPRPRRRVVALPQGH
jgi:hypothetical protein